jgi:hypothetical protein
LDIFSRRNSLDVVAPGRDLPFQSAGPVWRWTTNPTRKT